MRLLWSLSALAASAPAAAFAPVQKQVVCHRVTALNQVPATADPTAPVAAPATTLKQSLSNEEVKAKRDAALEKMKAKDASAKDISKDDLDVVFEDDHIVVVNKPPGVLTVPGKDQSLPSLNKAVFERFGSDCDRMDKMVVHRLGMDTSGLIVFARTKAALLGMNTLFRTRKIARHYEALVCGHVAQDEGTIDQPLMRDYEYPPFMRVSTDEHQRALLDLDAEEVGKQLLERPKESLTKFEVTSREDLDGHDVSRLLLTSISGRTHQLNVHCAAIGHPIVGDTVYGYGGQAVTNGGLEEGDLPEDKASGELQQAIATACGGKPMCVHAKAISFKHPVTREALSFESKASF